jgi:hypothetical protein
MDGAESEYTDLINGKTGHSSCKYHAAEKTLIRQALIVGLTLG